MPNADHEILFPHERLFGYLVKGLHDEGVPIDMSLATALFVPVAVIAIWFMVRRIRR